MSDKKIKKLLYNWKGVNSKGIKFSEDVTLLPKEVPAFKNKLKADGFNKVKLKKISDRELKKKIEVKDIAAFTRQISTMLQSGVPLVQSLSIIIEGTENRALKELVKKISKKVEEGSTFSEALTEHPKVFDELFCNLINAGEKSGSLENMLNKLADYMEKSETLKKKIKKALSYPITILIVAGIVTILLLVKVVPQFAGMFESFGGELPAFTQLVLDMSNFMQAYWYFFVGFGIAFKFGFAKLKEKEKVAYFLDKKILDVPIIGEIVRKSAIARFARTLGTTFKAGVPMLEGLEAAAGATGNKLYKDRVYDARTDVESGIPLNVAMKSCGIFPNDVVQMTAIGEESGRIDFMLDKSADGYEEDVDTLVDSMTAMIEPLVMAVLGVLVGGLLIAMYLPIFKMGGAM